jgi:HD-GYP domain-containing protein (c-di-GMP phosphodiesterase class II)
VTTVSQPALAEAGGLGVDGVELIADKRVRTARGLALRVRIGSVLLASSFAAVAITFAAYGPAPTEAALWDFALFAALYALLAGIEFEVGFTSAIPTQLVLVPMLFVLPPAWVPLCVAAASLARSAGELARGRRKLSTLPLALVSSWYSLAPALVLAVAFGSDTHAPRWSETDVYLLALLCQFALDFTIGEVWKRIAGISNDRAFAHRLAVYAVDVALAPIGLTVAFAAAGRPYLVLLVLPLVGLLSLFARERAQRVDAALELGHAYRGTALLLGDVVEADDAYTGEHSRDVVSLTVQVCERLGLDARQRRTAEFTALLHDVGKIRIPGEIINKAGPLDPDERRVIETHTVEGEAMLSKIGGLLGEVGSIVRSCHERWDGGGYPDGLAGEKIPLIARIVCCTDAYSAMTTDRPYRAARTSDEAVTELRACAGTHFDPRVVDAVVAVVG